MPTTLRTLLALLILLSVQPSAHSGWFSSLFESKEQRLESSLNTIKQDFFDAIHPVGTAKSIKLNSTTSNPPYLDVRMTVFWEGPINKEGYTKVAFRFDSEVGRITKLKVEDTNGITKENIGYAAGVLLGSLLQSTDSQR